MTQNRTQTEEKHYLDTVQGKLKTAYASLDHRVNRYAKEIQEQKTYLWEQRSDMDHAEKVSSRQAALQMVRSGEMAQKNQSRIARLIQSPWFGRIDFRRTPSADSPRMIYVGVHSFSDDDTGNILIHDWRAPVSTMFYDFELGPARYDSPDGLIDGELTLKRQFRIRNGEMEFMLESGLNIMDDVLQEELSRTSDERMKNIVATIQRDQNAIIRNEDADVLIIQGVAGSGKTSIALHRIAFLLYRHRETLSSKDILIISPNRVFGDFIANVLPELGEEQIAELGMDDLANELLEHKIKFQTFFEETLALMEKDDDALRQRIAAKSTVDFIRRLDAYIAHVESTRFAATDVWIGDYAVPAWVVEQAFSKRPDLPLAKRIRWAAEVVVHEVWVKYRYEVPAKERAQLKRDIGKMVKKSTLRALYREFFAWQGRPELFKTAPRGKLEHADVYPLIYLKIKVEGISSPYPQIRHLLVDEMQDYTPVQYAVLGKLFSCTKTILGDASQSVNPYSSSKSETIGEVFASAECVQLQKSYRSSYEITRFAGAMFPDLNIEAIERHGESPNVRACKSRKEEMDTIQTELRHFEQGSARTIGVICKSQKQAQKLYSEIVTNFPGAQLLTEKSNTFKEGITVAAVHMSKGLEFDEVLLPDASAENYGNRMDRHLLYVATTRAMHRLTLTYSGSPSPFIPKPPLNESE
jgi:DNA helicase II / ATP-dependent DNA helicase PcrA